MIYKIYANDKRFKRVEFQSGLNIILANKKQSSGKKDTRNGVGKTILIKIIHFCLGADLKKLKLPLEEIKDWVFSIELDLNGTRIIASRSIATPKIITVQEGDKEIEIVEEAWKQRLGTALFRIPSKGDLKYIPSFRGLIYYFIRYNMDAYISPFVYFRSQNKWKTQLDNAFLLDLDWKNASVIQEIENRYKENKDRIKLLKSGTEQSLGEMRAREVRLQKELAIKQKDLSSFKVHSQYKEIQEEADVLTQKIHDYINEKMFQQAKLDQYMDSIHSEKPPVDDSVEELYQEANLYFPKDIKKTLREAKSFHMEIIENRKEFLEAEIEEIRAIIEKNKKNIDDLDLQRAECMKILKTHGALEEYTALQERYTAKNTELLKLKSTISEMNKCESKEDEIKSEKLIARKKMQRNHGENEVQWKKTLSIFDDNTEALYKKAGNLNIEVSESGYKFDVKIEGSHSEGIEKMKIFCYDLMLVEVMAAQEKINFLIHDSTLFDAVDSRQKALALQHAHHKSVEQGFQYICTLNSDMLPNADFRADFDINRFVRLRLDDKEASDKLLGFKFDP